MVHADTHAYHAILTVAIAFGPLVGIIVSIEILDWLIAAAAKFTRWMRRISLRSVIRGIQRAVSEEKLRGQVPDFAFRNM